MFLVEGLCNAIPENCPNRERDAVALTWEARQKCRQRLKTMAGRELCLALPRGTVLAPGDVLHSDDRLVITVRGVPEPTLVLRPSSPSELALMCYQIGNLHRPIGFQGDEIHVPHEPVLEKQLERLGFAYTVEHRIFTHAGHPSHGHSHAH